MQFRTYLTTPHEGVMFTLRSLGKMKLLVFVAILTIALEGCSGQEQYTTEVEIYDQGYKEKYTYADGSYFLRLVLPDQQREEQGFFNENGIWTIRGKVSWYNPERTNKHTDYIENSRIVKSTDEADRSPQPSPPLSCMGLASVCG